MRAGFQTETLPHGRQGWAFAARAHAGLTQAELAERMHTSQPYIVRLESGRALPSLRTLLKVAEATGTEARFELAPPRKQAKRQTRAIT